MPLIRIRTAGPRCGTSGPVLAALLLVSGCVGGDMPGVSMFNFGKGQGPSDPAVSEPHLTGKGQVVSPLIDGLQTRGSVLVQGSPYHQVAGAVLDASKGAAQAELRVARLTAQAKSKNWLPTIGPNVSLTSLGALAANLVLEQTLFDNGRHKAERAYAAADVEVAAVTLASDLNERVYQGLSHYISGQRSIELIAVTEASIARMAEYERIMAVRVEGGLSDRSEQRVLTQKYTEMQATLSSDRETLTTARAELNAMTSRPMDGVRGLSGVAASSANSVPLSVLLARGDGARMVAQARVARAANLPGLAAQAGLDSAGEVDAGLTLGGSKLGFGTGDTLKVLAATEEVAARKVAEATETSNRRLVALEREIAALATRERDGAEVLRQTIGNLDLFTEQYRAGRKTLLELVSQFEGYTRMQREQASLKYEIAALKLDMARERGDLVSGAQM